MAKIKLLGRGVTKSVNLISPSASEIKDLNYKELQAVLGKLNLRKTGKKEELVQRLLDHYGLASEAAEGGADTEAAGKQEGGAAIKQGKQEVGEEEVKPRKKRKWTKTDPAKFAPNEYHENLFRANFPFVDIVHVPVGTKFPGINKFEGEVLDRDAKDDMFSQWVDRILKATHYFREPVNEKQSVQKHFALFEDLGDFTRIAPHEVEQVKELLGTKRKWNYVDERIQCRGCQSTVVDCICEVNEGIDIQFSAEDSMDPSMLEGELQDLDEVTGYADAVLHVWDDRVMRKQQKLGVGLSSQVDIDTERAVCVIQQKFLNDKYKFWAPFQGGYYAVKNAMQNIQKGHLLPIYVLVLTGTEWTYGKLESCGLVTVQNGRVDPASMGTFAEHQKLAGHGEFNYEMLQEKLVAGTAFYRKNYRDNPTAEIRDHTTLVGTFYLSSQWYALPNAEVAHGCNNAGVHRLFDGLMRVVVGDSVLDWRKEDFDAVYRRRQDYTRTCRACLKA